MDRMLKRIIPVAVIICVSILFTLIKADAEELSEYKQGYYTYTVTQSKATVVKVADVVSGSVSIPARLGGYFVVSIGSSAFEGCDGITALTIPDSVESIGEGAFSQCTAVEKFVVGSANNAFCTDSDGVLYNKSKTEIIAFPSAAQKNTYTVAADVTGLGKYAFYNCCNLMSFSVNSDNKHFTADEYGVLYNSDKTVLICYPAGNERTEYTLPSSIVSIAENAFNGCNNLKAVHFQGTQKQWESIEVKSGNGYVQGEALHMVALEEATAAGCESDGFSEGAYCSKCAKWLYGHDKTETARGHVFETYISDNNATCSQDGTKTARCDNCEVTKQITDEGSALNHKNAETIKGSQATCVSDGLTEGKYCPDCDTWLVHRKLIPAQGHIFEDYVTDNNSTYFSDGTKTSRCTNCTETDTVRDEDTKLQLGVTGSITSVATHSSVTLNWAPVTDATGYRVYLYNEGWKLLKVTQALKFKAQGLVAGCRYRFAVKAITTENGKTALSPSFASAAVYTKPLPPQSVKALTTTDKSIVLSWSRCKGATGYRIYVRNGKKWKAIKTTTASSYTVKSLEPDTVYTFAVKPYIKSENSYIWATSYSKADVSTRLATVQVVFVSEAQGRINFTWTDISGESGYQLWYCETGGGKYRKVSNYKAGTTVKSEGGFVSGRTYYFKMRAYKKTSSGYVYSSFSDVKAVKIR